MHDLVIKDAVIVDGTGAPPRAGDVAVDNGRVTEVGEIGEVGAGRQQIDADGRHLLPGWVDIHTHYDGQVTWDPEVSPSSWHGITTVVMGNCGVGFAPVRKGSEDFLIELMEGVEDIPGTALHEGIDWQWESFPEYLDALEAMPRVLDVAAQIPHAALRAYVMGDRAHDEASTEEVQEMAGLVEEALRAGAIGFTTSRTILHNSKHGLVPGTAAPAEELRSIGRAMARAGHGVFEMVSDHASTPTEREWMIELAGQTGVTVTYALAQGPGDPRAYRVSLEDAERLSAEGIDVVPQVSCRPTGMLFGLQSSLHPFITHPTYQGLANLPLAERVAQLSRPEIREQLVNEEPAANSPIARFLMSRWEQIFPLGDPPEYEPEPSSSVAAVAARENRDPRRVVLDWLLEQEGQALLFAPLASYADGDFEAIREMISHPRTVLGLSDGGAHCGLICDASMPTYLLTHWVRDRTRGPKLALETAVHLQTGRTASVYGLDDRGVITPGKRADFNLVDLDGMRLHAPRMAFDLPAGGRRLVQDVDGYDMTIVAGQVTFEKGQPTGARPGRLVRAAG
ncbi:MAG: N-acyl-D-amino-acid deacylase family protein [Acidimicrobiales bacterium]